YVCPNGRKVTYRGIKKEKTLSGYVTTKEAYIGESCKYCRKKKLCKRSKGNRWVAWNEKWQRLKAKSRKALEKHEDVRKQRSVEVETVFGHIKGNQGYRRFRLRGRAKVSTEWGLFSLGYDIKQMYRINRQKTS
ncbi:MAG: transposase, partial [Treponema sp.]|nr:transposase [Treponema sp.]